MATHGSDTSYLWHWLPISVDSGYLYFVTVATHIGYLFLLRSNIPQESFASTVSLYDGNAVIALHDKSGRLSDPTRPCSFAMTFNSTAERKDTLSHRPLKLIIPRLMSQTSSAAMARSQERISHSLNFLIDDKFLPFVIAYLSLNPYSSVGGLQESSTHPTFSQEGNTPLCSLGTAPSYSATHYWLYSKDFTGHCHRAVFLKYITVSYIL